MKRADVGRVGTEGGTGRREEDGIGVVFAEDKVADAKIRREAARVPRANGEAGRLAFEEIDEAMLAGGGVAHAGVEDDDGMAEEFARDGRKVGVRREAERVGEESNEVAAFVRQGEGDEDRRGLLIHRRRWDER